jgi:hypothetical protein
MLYLVGGASRSGKTWLARRLLERRQVAYFSIDALMMGFANGYPEFGLDPETSAILRGGKLWPILRAVAVNFIEEKRYHPDYLLEGDELLPEYVAELSQVYPGEVRACFLGYTRLAPLEKLQAVRRFEPDWACYYNDDDFVLSFLAEQVQYSRYLRQECALYGLEYFDGLADFSEMMEVACEYLVGDL